MPLEMIGQRLLKERILLLKMFPLFSYKIIETSQNTIPNQTSIVYHVGSTLSSPIKCELMPPCKLLYLSSQNSQPQVGRLTPLYLSALGHFILYCSAFSFSCASFLAART